jgi:hypothetical protein
LAPTATGEEDSSLVSQSVELLNLGGTSPDPKDSSPGLFLSLSPLPSFSFSLSLSLSLLSSLSSVRAKKIGHVYGIYTLYQTGKLSKEPLPSIADIEEIIRTRVHGNEELPASLGPAIEVMMEIYFPENPTAVAVARGEVTDFGSEVPNAPTVLRMTLHRGDLCRLIDNKTLLRLAFRIGHEDFFHRHSSPPSASPSSPSGLSGNVSEEREGTGEEAEVATTEADEVRAVEESWEEIARLLLSQCRWRRTLEGMAVGKGFYAKLSQATSLLSIEATDVTSEVLSPKAAKMKVPRPLMGNSIIKPRPGISHGPSDGSGGRGGGGGGISREWDGGLLCESKTELVLVVSAVLHAQCCQVMSLSERRPVVLLQAMVWQRGVSMGVVCFDCGASTSHREIYLLQPSPVEQETICLPLQAAGAEEVAINMSLFLTSLTYQDEVPSLPPPLPSSSLPLIAFCRLSLLLSLLLLLLLLLFLVL